jgi:hypothetical protein
VVCTLERSALSLSLSLSLSVGLAWSLQISPYSPKRNKVFLYLTSLLDGCLLFPSSCDDIYPFWPFYSSVKSRFLYFYLRPFYRYAIASFLFAFCSYAVFYISVFPSSLNPLGVVFSRYPVSWSRGSNSTTKQVIFSDWSRNKEKRSEPYNK